MIAASAPKRMRAHGGEHGFRLGWRNDREQLPFVRHVKRIESENLARALHFLADRNRRFVEQHAHLRALRDLGQRARNSAARRIAQNVDVFSRGENRFDEAVQRRGVARDFAFKFEALAHRHDRDAVHRHRAAHDDLVADLRARRDRC